MKLTTLICVLLITSTAYAAELGNYRVTGENLHTGLRVVGMAWEQDRECRGREFEPHHFHQKIRQLEDHSSCHFFYGLFVWVMANQIIGNLDQNMPDPWRTPRRAVDDLHNKKNPAISDGGITSIIILRWPHGRVVQTEEPPPAQRPEPDAKDDRKRVTHSTAIDLRSSFGADLLASCTVVFLRFFSSFIT